MLQTFETIFRTIISQARPQVKGKAIAFPIRWNILSRWLQHQ